MKKASLLCLCCGTALLLAAKYVNGFAQWYSTNIYTCITGVLGRISGIAGLSVAEAAVLVLPLLIIADVWHFRKRLTSVLAHIALITVILFFMYAANCGVNYYRNPFVRSASLKEAEFTEEQLAEFCEFVASEIEACTPDNDASGHPEWSELADSARRSMYKLSDNYPSLKGYYPDPKQLSLLSGLFSDMGVSGVYSPFTIEANVNGKMPDVEKPFTACHELSHLRGYMNEGEANYIGWLACIGSDDPAFNRSGWLIGWMHAGSALRRTAPKRYEAIYKNFPENASLEIEENSEFWASHEGRASELHDSVNDAYLKANGQTDGTKSYGMLTTMMLMWYFDQRDSSTKNGEKF